MRGWIEQHLELEAGACALLSREEIEGHATEAYERAGLAHALEGELPAPGTLARCLGVPIRIGPPPWGGMAALVGETIIASPMSRADRRALGVTYYHELSHWLLLRRHHTHADVIDLTLCLVAPWATVRSAFADGDVTPEAISLRQRHAPLWAIERRLRVVVELFEGIEVA